MTPYVQIVSAILGTVVAIVGAGMWAARRLYKYIRRLSREREEYKTRCLQLEARLQDSARDLEAASKSQQKQAQQIRLLKQENRHWKDRLDPAREKQMLIAFQQYQQVTATNQKLRDVLRHIQAKGEQLEDRLEDWQEKYQNAARIANNNARLARHWQQAAERDREIIQQLNGRLDHIAGEQEQLQNQLAEKEQELDQLEKQAEEMEERDNQTLDRKGRIWEQPLNTDGAPFVPAADRKARIISLINLKGGVGKTTLTANIAAALGEQGKKVLLLDLDYQRSLTRLCCSPDEIKMLHLQGRCLQHFLLHPNPDALALQKCTEPLKAAKNCKIVACSEALSGDEKADTLEDAEMHALLEWLISPQSPDVRLHLRRALHAPLLANEFDYVLLDCPPRLSTACVNALAASDFALIPVLLDRVSALHATPNLLRKLRRLKEAELLAELRILGIVANRTTLYGEQPTKAQQAVWEELREYCQHAWSAPVHFFQTTIKESAGFGAAAERHERSMKTKEFAAFYDDVGPLFDNLIAEIQGRIDHECQNLAAVPADAH